MSEIAAGARSELVSMAAPFAAFLVAWLVQFACKQTLYLALFLLGLFCA